MVFHLRTWTLSSRRPSETIRIQIQLRMAFTTPLHVKKTRSTITAASTPPDHMPFPTHIKQFQFHSNLLFIPSQWLEKKLFTKLWNISITVVPVISGQYPKVAPTNTFSFRYSGRTWSLRYFWLCSIYCKEYSQGKLFYCNYGKTEFRYFEQKQTDCKFICLCIQDCFTVLLMCKFVKIAQKFLLSC